MNDQTPSPRERQRGGRTGGSQSAAQPSSDCSEPASVDGAGRRLVIGGDRRRGRSGHRWRRPTHSRDQREVADYMTRDGGRRACVTPWQIGSRPCAPMRTRSCPNVPDLPAREEQVVRDRSDGSRSGHWFGPDPFERGRAAAGGSAPMSFPGAPNVTCELAPLSRPRWTRSAMSRSSFFRRDPTNVRSFAVASGRSLLDVRRADVAPPDT